MELKRQLLFCCISLLQLLHCRSEHSSIGFATVALCPDISALPSRHAKSKMLCGTACSAPTWTATCSTSPVRPDSATLATRPARDSDLRQRVRASAEPIAEQLSLKMLYRFGTHGLENAADPSKYRLWSGSATTIDAQGAHFVEDSNSFLMAATPCFEGFFNVGHKFSIFVRAKHPMNIDGTYMTMRECVGNKVSQDFYTYDRNFWHDMYWPPQPKYVLTKSGNVFTRSSSVALVSSGMTYDTNGAAHYFFNGSMHPAMMASPDSSGTLTNSRFQCIELGGYLKTPRYSVRGSMSCFAMSTRLLTQAEFVQLDNWCKQV
uniref:GON domain-containing protein n=1 Tax=Macrostomum lignano TaxID=282301 RepID=A0A1I8IBX9_9PLAT